MEQCPFGSDCTDCSDTKIGTTRDAIHQPLENVIGLLAILPETAKRKYFCGGETV